MPPKAAIFFWTSVYDVLGNFDNFWKSTSVYGVIYTSPTLYLPRDRSMWAKELERYRKNILFRFCL